MSTARRRICGDADMSNADNVVALTDEQLAIIMEAARPLEPERRSAFLEAVAAELAAIPREQRGVGSVARLVRQVQLEHYGAPDLSRGNGVTKYQRRGAVR